MKRNSVAGAETNPEEHTIELVSHAAAVTQLKIRYRIRPERQPCRESMIIGGVGTGYRFMRRFEHTIFGVAISGGFGNCR